MTYHTPKQPPEHYLLTLLQQTTDQERLAAILGALLSPKEQQELYKRLQIFALLQQGATQRDISTTVGVSLVTVSRGAKAYQQHNINQLLPDIGEKLFNPHP